MSSQLNAANTTQPSSYGVVSLVLWELSKFSLRVLGFFMYQVPSYTLSLLSRRFSITLKFSSV